MKKLFYPLAALLLTAAPASAQVEIGDHLVGIPSVLTSAKVPYIFETDKDLNKGFYGGGTVYDYDLNKILTVQIPSTDHVYKLDFDNYFDENGFCLDVNGDLIISQTLFNDDEDWEYINEVIDYSKTDVRLDPLRTYEVKKLDGTVIGTLVGYKCWLDAFVKLGNKYYVNVEEYETENTSTYKYYTISEFRKLFNPATRVAATPAMVKSGQTFDLSGRRTRSNAHGIVVKNNKKVLK